MTIDDLPLEAPREIFRLRRRSQRTFDRPAKSLDARQRSTRDTVLQRYESGVYAVEDVACTCGSRQGFCLADRDRYGLPSPSVICTRCGVVRTTPRLSGKSLALFYEEDYRPLYTGAEVAPGAFFDDQVRHGRAIYELSRPYGPFRRVADIGCGAGGILIPFREAGCTVLGCDVGGAYLARGRQHGLDLRHGSYETLSDAAPFDLVVLSHVFEHVLDPYEFLINVKRILEPETGLIYVEAPGLRTIARYGDPLAYFQNAHLYNFDLGTLRRLFRSAGYELVAGDEYIHALFKTGLAPEPLEVDATAVGSVLESIATAERHRLRNRFRRVIEGSGMGTARRVVRTQRRRLKRTAYRAVPPSIMGKIRHLRSRR